MKFVHVAMVCCFSAVCAQAVKVMEVSGHVGGEVSIRCSGSNSSEHNSMYFCKGACTSGRILIETERRRSAVTQRGRYSMKADRGDGAFSVTIKKLKRGDAGRYLCGGDQVNGSHQEVDLRVLDASSAPAGTPPSTTTMLKIEAETLSWANFLSVTEPSPATITLPSSERKTNQQESASLTVVIIVSGSLAVLVFAIIPIIFCGRWRTNTEGQNRPEGRKGQAGRCEENADTPPTQVAVGLQAFEPEADPVSDAHDTLQYAAIYQALDPKTLD
ncbi:uncharacterized protein LOC114440940 isoform X2 [Parambassis ranga]|uniref:Uncharacterized protein LOC114440940 isoform X2 n=1 Tax=Parambassis ranga TaxID=210632 RepID=A0A6P7IYL6_9TELE|nr:uncharacterized protein LOC114440940 isoform X2 [Parambassis ranga]